MINDGKRSFTYTADDKPLLVTQGAETTRFSYGPNRELIKRVDARSSGTTTTLLIDNLYEQVQLASGVTEHKFVIGNAIVTRRTVGGPQVYYLHKDQQGSTTAITNLDGNPVQQLLYDPWGRQYQVSAAVLTYSSQATTYGYTGHDMVNDFEVIHMGGRSYNPVLGRFMQADPFIQQASNLQSFNRYAYVLNNPMRYTDPSGYFFKAMNPFKKIIRGAIRALGAEVSGLFVAIGSVFCGPGYAACVAAGNYEIARAYGASKTGALRGAAAAGVLAYANPASQIGWTDVAIQGVSIVNPDAGRLLRFTQYGIDANLFSNGVTTGMQSLYSYAAHEYVNSKVGEELARFANKNGMSLNEFNALLTLGSFAGNKVAGSRYRGDRNGTELIDGLGRRGGLGYESFGLSEFNPLSLPFDAMDYLLGTQGLLTASAHEYAQSGNRSSPLVGYSLGAMDVGNLAARGYAKNVYAYSLPLLNAGVGSLGVMNGRYDPVNLGAVGWLFSPHATWSNATLRDHANYQNYPGLDLYDWRPKK